MPEYQNLDQLKSHYQKVGLGVVKVKLFLNNIINELLTPIREKRKELEANINNVYQILFDGSERARKAAQQTLAKMKDAMGLDNKKLQNK